jgi:hypothetical protein
MPALQNDPDIHEAPFSLKEKLTIQQVRFVGARLRDLRGGSVCLNSFEPFCKWISRSVMPRPGLVAMG